MESVAVTIRVCLPIYIMIAVGYAANRRGIVSRPTLKELNAGVFRIFLPLLLFENMYTSHLDVTNIKALLFAVASVILIFLICHVVVFHVIGTKSRAATIVQGMYRSNFALLGIALTETLYGSGETDVTGMLVAVIIPLYNVLAVILFESSCQNGKTKIGKIVKGILKNPLILWTCTGLVLNLLHITIPVAVNSVVTSLGQVATPLALFVMGGNFEAAKTKKNRNPLIAVSTTRLIIIPILCTAMSIILGFRGKSLYALFLMYATPTAVASYAMASSMGGDEDLAGEIVLVTTAISMVSIGLGVYVLTALRLI
ncbi:MAG: AEC family transporter [Ruminococcus sp.]|nr:AEC family transporter [Ruminococcus sp.]